MPIQALLDMQTRRDADYGREMRRRTLLGLCRVTEREAGELKGNVFSRDGAWLG